MARKKPPRRKIHDLKWAELTDKGMPTPKHKAGSSRKAGVLYEYRVATYLKSIYGDRVVHGQWIKYEDERGTAVCQPDIIVMPKGKKDPLVIIECKLTWKSRAGGKLRGVYKTCLQHIYPKRKILLVQVCKRLAPKYKGVMIEELDEVYKSKFKEEYVTLNLRAIAEI